MSLDDTPPGRRGDAARVLTIDLDELTWALNSRDPLAESSHWLNLESGTIQSLIGPDALDEADEDPRDDDRWLLIEPIESSDAFRVRNSSISAATTGSPGRSGKRCNSASPFRRFKDVLAAHQAQREAWFAFERQAMEVIARGWCEEHGISPRWGARPNRPTP